MDEKRNKNEKTLKFLKWIRKYSGWWYLICTPNDDQMNLQMMKLLVEELYQESMFEVIVILLTVHRNEPFMKNISDDLLLDMLIDHWTEDKDTILQSLIEYLA